jgi:PAS domain-containing protein
MSAILGTDTSSSGTPPSGYQQQYPGLSIPFQDQFGNTPPAFTPASFGGTTTESVFSDQPSSLLQQQQSHQHTSHALEVPPADAPSVYHNVTKAHDYREGFHFLMRHLKERYTKNDILRIIRAIAIFRPSLIALCMPLSEEDEIFVEKSFQRSVLELSKLISFNGTPTVAWRRTGEICVVGVEFSVLTGWSREELLTSRKYIYELFENQSAVEYWEQFATHAFENTTQSVHTHCVLLTKTGAPVLTAFCFSIRRDIFDLPNIVIGEHQVLSSGCGGRRCWGTSGQSCFTSLTHRRTMASAALLIAGSPCAS